MQYVKILCKKFIFRNTLHVISNALYKSDLNECFESEIIIKLSRYIQSNKKIKKTILRLLSNI